MHFALWGLVFKQDFKYNQNVTASFTNVSIPLIKLFFLRAEVVTLSVLLKQDLELNRPKKMSLHCTYIVLTLISIRQANARIMGVNIG